MVSSVLRRLAPLLILLALIASAGTPFSTLAQDDDAEADDSETSRSSAQIQFIVRGDGQSDGDRIITEIEPGESAAIRIFIGNAGEESLEVVTFTSDISTKLHGGLQLAPQDSEQHEPTSWIDYPTETFDIEPQAEVGRDALIDVPEGTEPGEYVIPIAVETVNAIPVEGAPNLAQKIRKVLVVYVVVPGDVQAGFELGEPRIEYLRRGAAVYVPVVNTAQTSLRMTGQMTIENLSGVTMYDATVVMGTVYGHHETSIYQILTSPLPPGEYLISVQLIDTVSGFTNGLEDVPITMPEPPSGEVVPLAFGDIIIIPNAEPIQFAAIGVEIVNNAQTIRSARLIVIVQKDGELLEEFSLGENLTIDQGVTTVAQRYLPLTGWEPGEYSFSLRLETVGSGGAASVLLTQEDVATITVGD